MDSLIVIAAFGLGLAARFVGLPPMLGFLAAGFAERVAAQSDLG
jgi:Kef-type K+ transport system membrane component KefB